MFEKRNIEFKFIFFFFIFFIIFLKQVFAYNFEDYKLKLQYLIGSIPLMQNIIYILCYIFIIGVLFYFILKAVSISPFSEHVSFILSIGLVLILAFMKVIGKISTLFFNILMFFISKGGSYLIIFLATLFFCLLIFFYIVRWVSYFSKGSKEKRKKQKEELEKAELKGVIQGIRGRGKSFIQRWLEKLGIHK